MPKASHLYKSGTISRTDNETHPGKLMLTANDFEKGGHYVSAWSPVKTKLSTAAHSDVCTLEGRLTDWREITEPQILTEVQMQRHEIIKEPSLFT